MFYPDVMHRRATPLMRGGSRSRFLRVYGCAAAVIVFAVWIGGLARAEVARADGVGGLVGNVAAGTQTAVSAASTQVTSAVDSASAAAAPSSDSAAAPASPTQVSPTQVSPTQASPAVPVPTAAETTASRAAPPSPAAADGVVASLSSTLHRSLPTPAAHVPTLHAVVHAVTSIPASTSVPAVVTKTVTGTLGSDPIHRVAGAVSSVVRPAEALVGDTIHSAASVVGKVTGAAVHTLAPAVDPPVPVIGAGSTAVTAVHPAAATSGVERLATPAPGPAAGSAQTDLPPQATAGLPADTSMPPTPLQQSSRPASAPPAAGWHGASALGTSCPPVHTCAPTAAPQVSRPAMSSTSFSTVPAVFSSSGGPRATASAPAQGHKRGVSAVRLPSPLPTPPAPSSGGAFSAASAGTPGGASTVALMGLLALGSIGVLRLLMLASQRRRPAPFICLLERPG